MLARLAIAPLALALLIGLVGVAPVAAAPEDDVRVLNANLDRASDAIQAGDAPKAAGEMRSFQQAWPASEGLIRAKSPAAYSATENAMAEAYARLVSTPPDLARAGQLVAGMRAQLAPFAEERVSYGILD